MVGTLNIENKLDRIKNNLKTTVKVDACACVIYE